MLVLSRQRDETIMIGDEIEITVVDIRGDKVRLGITAPTRIAVHRKEVYEAIKRENEQAAAFNERQLRDLQEPVTWAEYLTEPDFWNRTLQNWQSELLAVASMVILSIYLRQRGSPESKPVGAPHDATGVEG